MFVLRAPPHEGRVCTANLEKERNKHIPLYISHFTRSECQPIVVGGVNLYWSVSEPILVAAPTYIGWRSKLYSIMQ